MEIRVIHHLIFQRKHGLDAENLTSAQRFPPFGEGGPFVVHFNTFGGTEYVMKVCNDILLNA